MAESEDRMNARVFSHHSGVPETREASGLSPAAIRLRPNGRRIRTLEATHSTSRISSG